MRTPWWWTLGALALSALAGGCGGPPPAPAVANKPAAVGAQEPPAAAAQKPAVPAVVPRAAAPGPPLPSLTYEGKGRRDPFSPVVLEPEKARGLEVSTVRLAGILQGHQLTALIEAPGGLGYILKPGDALGNGRVTDITPGSVTFAVAGRAGQRDTSLTLRLAKD